MVRAGFDCWFGNSRGNKYSRYNTYLPRSSEEFWEFTTVQMAEFDVPACVDYVLENTGMKKLTWIGHSQGTAMMFARLADDPDFADKLNVFIALAPIASVTYEESGVLRLVGATPLAQILQFLRLYNFTVSVYKIPGIVYDVLTFAPWISDLIVGLFDGDLSVDDMSRMPVTFAHELGGTSVRNMEYWEQGIHHKTSAFCKMDYGALDNMRIYANTTAPCYDLGAIKAPIAWWVGTKDKLADTKDVAWLRNQLAPGVLVKDTTLENYGHLSVLWPKNATWFEDVVETARQYGGMNLEPKFLN